MHRHLIAALLMLATAAPVHAERYTRTPELRIGVTVSTLPGKTGGLDALVRWTKPYSGRDATRHVIYRSRGFKDWVRVGATNSDRRNFVARNHVRSDRYMVVPSSLGYGYRATPLD